MQKNDHSFNVILSDALFTALNETAAKTGMTKSNVLRYAFTYYHAMVVNALPMCSNGQQCLCPQVHQLVGAPPPNHFTLIQPNAVPITPIKPPPAPPSEKSDVTARPPDTPQAEGPPKAPRRGMIQPKP